ncbi:MAG: NAD-dependent epimerase/dehydratase family protein [Clostridium sp.]|nr:NAD-dependent epimerase/dehydratase family protein [Clostridium sp.]
MKKVLVIGANGFIGQNLCVSLSEEYKVTAVDIRFDELLSRNDKIETILCDCIGYVDFDLMVKNFDVIFFLMCTTVPKEGTERVSQEITENLFPMVRLLDAIVKGNQKIRFIFPSSGGTVYGDTDKANRVCDYPLEPICGYGTLKLVQEEYIKLYGRINNLDYIIARLSNPYGIGQNREKPQGIIPILINKLHNDEAIEIYGETIRDYIYIDDLIGGLTRLIEYSGSVRTFNIGTGEGSTLSHVLDVIQKVSGGSLSKVVKYDSRRKCDVLHSILDISESINELGWKPQYSLEEGIEAMVEKMERK